MLIHSYAENSYVNGPGNRFVLWTQGCSKKCKNCFNPLTWDNKGKFYEIDDLFQLIKKSNSEGLTLTGGDPLEQSESLYYLLCKVNELNLKKGIILFTGYELSEIKEIGGFTEKCLDFIDLLIDGRYIEELNQKNSLKGSENQNFHFFSNKIQRNEIEFDHYIEINNFVDSVFLTGFPKLNKIDFRKYGLKIL